MKESVILLSIVALLPISSILCYILLYNLGRKVVLLIDKRVSKYNKFHLFYKQVIKEGWEDLLYVETGITVISAIITIIFLF